MAYQSLYRRYRSQRFEEVLGQEHVTKALRNAVREGRVAQGYLFSGPRGTGKTSTARILAKVLNCAHPVDGEPDTTCDACLAVEEGRQVDWLQELDAASNNGVDAMRDLLGRVSMGTSGNRKVYVLDEVHMLSTAASNALLKTLEEPPDHVVFVLATTEPEKVLPTIRSRTQHYEFNLLPAGVLADHVRHVIADAGLDLGEDAVDHVVRVGRGSARDTLSALDQVAAAGGVTADAIPVEDLVDALGRRDAGGVLLAVDAAVRSGRDPRVLAEALIETLRHAFLVAMGAPAGGLTERAEARAREVSEALGPATLTRALEAIGTSMVEMRHAPDARIPLEVALVQLARPEASRDVDALARRVEQLERAVAAGTVPAGTGAGPAGPPPSPSPSVPSADAGSAASAPAARGPAESTTSSKPPAPAVTAPTGPATTPRGAEAARARLARHDAEPVPAPEPAGDEVPPGSRPTLGGVRQARAKDAGPASAPAEQAPAQPAVDEPAAARPVEPTPTPSAAPAPTPSSAPSPDAGGAAAPGGVPDPEVLDAALAAVLDSLGGRAKALYKIGHFVPAEGTRARFALPNEPHLRHCEPKLDEVRAALEANLGRSLPLVLVVDGGGSGSPAPAAPDSSASAAAPAAGQAEEDVDLDQLTDAPDATTGGVAQLQDAFPGAELLEDP